MSFAGIAKQFFASALAAVLCAAIAVPPALGQSAAEDKSVPTNKIERLNRAPVSKEILKVTLPRPIETTLPNGLNVLILEDHRFPLVSVQFEIDGSGAMFEPANLPGLAATTARSLTDGTATRTSNQIAEQIDALGASLNATAPFGSQTTTVSASGLSDNFDRWFAIVLDVLLHPSFPADELAQYKERAKPNLMQQKSQPNFLANQTFNHAVYGSFPAATVSATPESLDAMTPALLADWHAKRYAPEHTILAISGDVRADLLIPQLRQWLGSWQRSTVSLTLPATPPAATKDKIYLIDRPASVQTTLLMGNLAITRSSPDYPALLVLNEVLGAGSSSRLFLNLREDKGYTYGVYSNIVTRKYVGPWTAGGEIRTEVTDGAMTEFIRELNRIRDEKVPPAELEAAERAVVARFALSLESPQQMIAYAITRKAYNFPADYWDKFPSQIMAVTQNDVLRVAKEYINPATMQVVAVGDASKIESVMEKYGTVEVVTSPGKPSAGNGKPSALALP